MSVDVTRVEALARELLIAIGEDPNREGLAETPARVARWWREFVDYDPGETSTTFATSHAGQVVTVSGIRVWSLCEHHLLPFWCDVSISYRPVGRVLGLSKLARIAHDRAHRLQVQERIAGEIADAIIELAGTPDVSVTTTGEHLCMTARGIRTPGLMSCTDARGSFQCSL